MTSMRWLVFFLWAIVCVRAEDARYLKEKGQKVEYSSYDWPHLQIVCSNGSSPSVFKYWSSAHLRLSIQSDDFQIFLGKNVTDVQLQHHSHKTAWIHSPFRVIGKEVSLNPFEASCIGVFTSDAFAVTLDLLTINFWQVCLTIAGLVLFLHSPRFCRNTFFHYTTGVGLGIVFSFFILTYMLQRKLGSSWFSWILGFYSLSLYFVTSMWHNLHQAIVSEGSTYVLSYIAAAAVVSFAICYRLGPVKDQRTLNLIQWSMQAFALVLLYAASYQQRSSVAIILALVAYQSVPDKQRAHIRTWYQTKIKRPEVRLLTEAEYMDQSRIATAQAIADLREHCHSPKCDAWKLVTRVNSPLRFAEFVNGGSHITETEILDYSQHDGSYELDDDDDDDDNDEIGGMRSHQSVAAARREVQRWGAEPDSTEMFNNISDDDSSEEDLNVGLNGESGGANSWHGRRDQPISALPRLAATDITPGSQHSDDKSRRRISSTAVVNGHHDYAESSAACLTAVNGARKSVLA